MLLTLSKRFEFSSSRRVVNPGLSDTENRKVYGRAAGGNYGHGINGVVYLIFSGPVDPVTGMMINISTVKARTIELLSKKYDHKFLNIDTPPFDKIPPTAANLARLILADTLPLFADLKARPVACYLEDTDVTAATAFVDGRIEEHHWLEFSASRSTRSPHLSESENAELFGRAASLSGHGHNYRLRVTLGGEFNADFGVLAAYDKSQNALGAFHELVDHKNLNVDVPPLANTPMTTESLAAFALKQIGDELPVVRVQLFEMSNFFAAVDATGNYTLGLSDSFHSAHRLHSDGLSELENQRTYGKCSHPSGHGHQYRVEATIGGTYDNRTGTLYHFNKFCDALKTSIEPWAYKHLNLETSDFAATVTTGENIVSRLWERLDPMLENRLVRLRLWETPNNRFTLRRS
jgi:6-pyruvoyltetrahydropterin/6-carboxytetrahydropterin synthase